MKHADDAMHALYIMAGCSAVGAAIQSRCYLDKVVGCLLIFGTAIVVASFYTVIAPELLWITVSGRFVAMTIAFAIAVDPHHAGIVMCYSDLAAISIVGAVFFFVDLVYICIHFFLWAIEPPRVAPPKPAAVAGVGAVAAVGIPAAVAEV